MLPAAVGRQVTSLLLLISDPRRADEVRCVSAPSPQRRGRHHVAKTAVHSDAGRCVCVCVYLITSVRALSPVNVYVLCLLPLVAGPLFFFQPNVDSSNNVRSPPMPPPRPAGDDSFVLLRSCAGFPRAQRQPVAIDAHGYFRRVCQRSHASVRVAGHEQNFHRRRVPGLGSHQSRH